MSNFALVWLNRESSNNIVSQALVDHLKVRVLKHHYPYFFHWFMTSDEVKVRHMCQVINEDNNNTVQYDVVPMDIGDILLRIPGMRNKNGIRAFSCQDNLRRDFQATYNKLKKQETHLLYNANLKPPPKPSSDA